MTGEERRNRLMEFANNAPIDMGMVEKCVGHSPNLVNCDERAAFFAVWAFLRFEYARAMMAEYEGKEYV